MNKLYLYKHGKPPAEYGVYDHENDYVHYWLSKLSPLIIYEQLKLAQKENLHKSLYYDRLSKLLSCELYLYEEQEFLKIVNAELIDLTNY